jgi:hypothetical protein
LESIGASKLGELLKVSAPLDELRLTVAESVLGLKVHVEVSFAVSVVMEL